MLADKKKRKVTIIMDEQEDTMKNEFAPDLEVHKLFSTSRLLGCCLRCYCSMCELGGSGDSKKEIQNTITFLPSAVYNFGRNAAFRQ